MQVAGLMSGTSLDGLTIAQISISDRDLKGLVEIKRTARKAKFLKAKTFNFPKQLRRDLTFLAEPQNTISTEMISKASANLGRFALLCLRDFTKNESKVRLNLVGFHGQTVFHLPSTNANTTTYQIGDPSTVCYEMKIPVVSDFRSMDTAAGGQGAPLVPIADYLRYSKIGTNRVVANIGGIANITFLSGKDRLSELRAFDVGPGNILIDGVMDIVTGGRRRYDGGGKMALRGKMSAELFEWLLGRDDFRLIKSPKSTGRERYNQVFVKQLVRKGRSLNLSDEDIVATTSYYTVHMIAYHIKRLERRGKIVEVIVGGGGTKNRFLMDGLRGSLPNSKISIHDDYGIPSWCWESVAFAFIAFLTYRHISGNVLSATGASSPVVLGRINFPPKIRLL